jgi:peptide/nickel transport system substrate-binding protein
MTRITTRQLAATLAVVTALVLAAGCGKSASTTSSGGAGTPSPTAGLVTTSPAATGPYTKPIVWALYRETSTLDPIFVFDYPDNTPTAAMCDTLLRQSQTGQVGAGLAALSYPDPTTMVFNIKSGIKFWDGTPLTSADVLYSLQRQTDAKLGGYYGQVFSNVKSMTATGPLQVTIKLTKPDYWLAGELSSSPGFIIEKKFAEAAGDKYGTPAGGVMCTGPFMYKKWAVGDKLSVVANPHYWDKALAPKASEIDFEGVPSDSAFTTGIESGEITAGYPLSIATLDQLKTNSNVHVYLGTSYESDAMIISNSKGPLANPKVRTALSMAIDRQGLIDANYKGAALLPHAVANPGTWGYAKSVFQKAWNDLPAPKLNVNAAKAMIQAAGATGDTITLGMSSELPNNNTEAIAVQSAGESIGLKVNLHSVSAANYINFFIDPNARKGIDAFFTVNYPDYADPAGLYSTYGLPGGSQNYNDYNNPKVTHLLETARSTANPTKRAQLVVAAQAILQKDLPWIPITSPDTILIMNKAITGPPVTFSYMFSPWYATQVGANG